MNMHVSHTCDQQILRPGRAEYQLHEMGDAWQLLSVTRQALCPALTAAHHFRQSYGLSHLHGQHIKKKEAELADPELSLHGQAAPEVLYAKMPL